MIHNLYFSPTGSTKKVVTLISDAWKGDRCELDFSIPNRDYAVNTFAKGELCIIGVPSFGGRVPAVALTHLKQMKAANTPTILITTYGNRDYDDTLLELKTAMAQNGFHVIAAIAAVTEHSIMHQYGTGRPNAEDEKTLRGYGEKMKQALESGADLPEVAVKGNTPYREYSGLPFKPKADKSCSKCGICAKACPMNAIPLDNPLETLKERCITCMRCVAICPQHARKLNHIILSVAGKKMEKSCALPKENILFFG